MTDVLDEITPDDTTEAPRAPDTVNWRRESAEGRLTLWLDCEDTGTNVISEAVLRELDTLLDEAKQAQPDVLVIRSAKPGGFAAGADIDGFADLRGEDAVKMLRRGHDVLDKLAALPVTTVAVIHGTTLGGGFELALACDHRIGIDGVKVGFPEIQLGLHPGLGGTFRLTSLIDPVEAMQMMLKGSSAHDRKAKKLGILDALVPERHVDAAVAAAASGELEHEGGGFRASALRTRAARSLAANRMRAESEKKAPRKHFPAPFALIDLWEDHGGDAAEMQKAEIASFAELLDSTTAQNLIRVFFLRRRLKSSGGREDGIAHVHVIGAGAMGGEIAAWAAMQGKRVTIEDVALDPLGETIRRATRVYDGKHLSGIEKRDALDRLMPDPDRLGRARADLVIEAAPEKPGLKEDIYAELTDAMKPGAILATNTSSLPLASLVDAAPDPARFAGLHFFNPVSKMPLVEIVSHDMASTETLDRLAAFTVGIDRLPARVTDYPGFLVNRILAPYMMEAMLMLDDGHDKAEIDRAALAFGMPMGPVTLADQVGLDICLEVGKSLQQGLDTPVAAPPDWLRDKVEKGETGKKAGKGLYDYDSEEPPQEPADDPDQGVIDRLILPMCNAAAECLRKGVAPDAETIDAAMIFGTGWAPFRGGPLHYARVRRDVPDVLRSLQDLYGDRFAPDEGWSDLG
ncbi:putative fatty acid oxidation complex alpha subunit [Pseudooceanicola batsensis HTCC2597]|uniref:enoyl-CoA hydratase n=1 Tax=Pseudooceanicola batsensis (strain ATCC BAA-863 / DSM 15984 / KCTC 12145 / HTCC2597) TaxID=252305 RepID=A3TT55_PSEBH|nr:3-hydroxyacyl-CoA dehydrogenase NAD-binding domain-containing protein [Pseudooceanicola batsensis]EAQ04832.1 putative fatty acid oxidation complex alpha subunit [Pseudooceanicola batsensis HTCC2597]